MRIMLTGAAPWCNGSYGKPMRYVVPLLHAAGYECAIACFYGFMGGVADTVTNGAPVRLYPTVRDTRLNDIIEYHVKDWEAQAVISFQDIWVCENWGYPREFVWLPWMPVDTEPVNPLVTKALDGAYAPFCYSRWGTEQLLAAGWPTARHVPLGVDLDIYRPMDRTMARKAIGLPDGFIAGMVAANAALPPRKAFPEVLQAWRKWLDQGNDGTLYIHTTVTPSRAEGFAFQVAMDQLGLPWSTLDDPNEVRRAQAKVLFPSQYRVWCHAVEDDELAQIYNCMDVLLSPSMAEGFGLPILEAQACGVPVVTLNVTSMPEITFAGICLEPVQPVWEPLGAWRGVPPIDGLVDAIQWAYDMSEAPVGRQHLAEKARANAADYTWAHAVNDCLIPVLEELA